jgi:F420H(2)-dependent quinone reductase
MRRWSARLHALVYRLTGGRLLGRMGGQPVLLLETIGRRSGRRRATPVQYLPRREELVVVGSNAGAPRPPAWCLNLNADPRARARIRHSIMDVRARAASDEEHEGLWRELSQANPYMDRVARKAGRELPIFVLTPTSGRKGGGAQ